MTSALRFFLAATAALCVGGCGILVESVGLVPARPEFCSGRPAAEVDSGAWRTFEASVTRDPPLAKADLAIACTKMREFSCDRSRPQAYNLAILACHRDAESHMAEARAALQKFISGESGALPDVRDPPAMLWPDGRPPNYLSPPLGLTPAIARLRELAPDDALLAEADALIVDVAAVGEASKKFPAGASNCGELATIESVAGTVQGRAAEYFAALLTRIRRANVERLETLGSSAMLPRQRSPATARQAAAEMKCFDAVAAAALTAKVEAWATPLEKSAQEEKACRADPACYRPIYADQIGPAVCACIRDKRDAEERIAELRRGEAKYGYINRSELRDWVEAALSADTCFKEQSAEFRRWVELPFNTSFCSTGRVPGLPVARQPVAPPPTKTSDPYDAPEAPAVPSKRMPAPKTPGF